MRITDIFPYQKLSSQTLPLFHSPISAGFPSPADDFIEDSIDLNDLLIQNSPATYIVRVSGDSMKEVGIFPDDLLIVDASKTPMHNHIVIASVDGEFLVKRFWIDGETKYLKAENGAYPMRKIINDDTCSIFGVVTGVVRKIL
jgi:DNA polymerase V